MLQSWKSISVTASLAALLLFGVTTTPNAAQLQNGNTSAQTTVVADAPATNATAAQPAAPKKQKSVLDADALESPFSFFKDVSGVEEDESEVNVKPSVVVLALKALAATLLSTIM
ncbi:hypothetical protein [uncultured Pontibacter sp.]|uniref:hypothetical protein n=1 Tax=uncultured Pontibacter sp. TaxID=453356 RepID=UPI002634BD1D|nr:hypothetical protein [uncultured Pontibacter sp.]